MLEVMYAAFWVVVGALLHHFYMKPAIRQAINEEKKDAERTIADLRSRLKDKL